MPHHPKFGRRDFLQISMGGLALATIATPAAAAAKFDYGVASIDPIYSPLYVALKKGFIDKNAVEMNYINVQSGPRGKQLLAAGQIAAVTTGATDSIALSIAGKPSVLVYCFDDRVPFANVMINKDVHASGVDTIAKLAGRSLGVTQPQAATWLMAVYLAEKAGVKDKITIRPLGDFTTMMAAVKSRGVDACMATFAMLEKGREEGWGVPLFEITDAANWDKTFGGALPGAGTYVLADTIKSRPADVQAVVTGLCKGADFIHASSPEETVDLILADYLQGYTRSSAVAAVTTFKKVWSRDNIITPENYARLTGIMGSGRMYSDAEMATASYATNVDMSFVKKARGLA